jgi:hypothetical protein
MVGRGEGNNEMSRLQYDHKELSPLNIQGKLQKAAKGIYPVKHTALSYLPKCPIWGTDRDVVAGVATST